MAVVTFWSDWKGEKGKTASMAVIATQLAFENNYKVLIIDTKHNDTGISDCFWDASKSAANLKFKDDSKRDIDTGVKGFAKAILSNKTSPEIITNYTKVVFKDRLEILTDEKSTPEEYAANRPLFKDMINIANKYYDLVFVDIDGPLEEELVSEIMKISNIIVPTMTQSLRNLNTYLEMKNENELLRGGNVINLVGRYDISSKYNLKNVGRYIGSKKVYGIPYNTLFFESTHEGKVADYFIRFRKAKATDPGAKVTRRG